MMQGTAKKSEGSYFVVYQGQQKTITLNRGEIWEVAWQAIHKEQE